MRRFLPQLIPLSKNASGGLPARRAPRHHLQRKQIRQIGRHLRLSYRRWRKSITPSPYGPQMRRADFPATITTGNFQLGRVGFEADGEATVMLREDFWPPGRAQMRVLTLQESETNRSVVPGPSDRLSNVARIGCPPKKWPLHSQLRFAARRLVRAEWLPDSTDPATFVEFLQLIRLRPLRYRIHTGWGPRRYAAGG